MRDNILRLYAASLEETRKLCEDIPAAQFNRIVNGKSPAWLVGHLAIGSDFVADLGAAQGRLNDWTPLFAPGSQPTETPNTYPSKDALLAALAERHAVAATIFREAADAHLHSELPIPEYRSFFPTIADAIVYLMASHEYYHNGQLQQWKLAARH